MTLLSQYVTVTFVPFPSFIMNAMPCVDSACFDARLIRDTEEPIVPFHVANPKDPGTTLLVEGTTSTFQYLGDLYLALKRDSRCIMSIHEFHMDIAKREVQHLERLWNDVIHNAKQTLRTLEETYEQRLSEPEGNRNVVHVTMCENLMTDKPHVWRSKVIVKEKPLTLPLQRSPRKFPSILPRPTTHPKTFKRCIKADSPKKKKAMKVCVKETHDTDDDVKLVIVE